MSCSQDQRVSITEELITGLLPNSIVSLQGGGLRWLDAWGVPQEDFNVVTRPAQFNDTQNWRLTLVPRASGDIPVFTVVQVSSGRFLDAQRFRNFTTAWLPARSKTTTPSFGDSSTTAVGFTQFNR